MRGLMLLALALAGCAGGVQREADADARDAADLAKTLEGRVAGAPVECVDPARLSGGPRVIGHTLIYTDGGRLWRNDIADCPWLRSDPLLVTEIFGGQLCRNDRFRTVERGGGGIPSADCRYGAFTPYTKPKS